MPRLVGRLPSGKKAGRVEMKARRSGRQQPLFVKNGDTALLNVAGFDVGPLNLSCGDANAVGEPIRCPLRKQPELFRMRAV